MELSEIKRDKALLLTVLGIKREGQHINCPMHADKNGSFAVWKGRDGCWLFKCHAGCGEGTIIDAAMSMYRVNSPGDALKELESRLGVKVGRDEELEEPRIDIERAEKFIAAAHENLLTDFEIQEEYMNGKRGIFNLEMVKRHKLGFLKNARFKGKTWRITGWTIPVYAARGHLVGVKLHCEVPPWSGPKAPKCLWAPFGTFPADKPRNGTQTFWPAPEALGEVDELYLVPGELKAAALLGAGLPAISPTSGESGKFPARMIERIKALKPRTVGVVFDDDDPKKRPNGKWVSAGHDWRDNVCEALRKAGLVAVPFAFGASALVQAPPSDAPNEDLDALESEWNQATGEPSSSAEAEEDSGGWITEREVYESRMRIAAERRGFEVTWINPEAELEDLAFLTRQDNKESDAKERAISTGLHSVSIGMLNALSA